MNVSVVIPTCDRKSNLLQLLKNLNDSTFIFDEVIVVDSGTETLSPKDHAQFKNLRIQYIKSEKSVCVQRNIGIQKATTPWIFLCDDDIEVPIDYIEKLTGHIAKHPEAGAVAGLVLQKEKGEWVSQYPEKSTKGLIWKYFFKLGIWGQIETSTNNFIIKKINQYYKEKGNHLSKAGWPILSYFSGNYFQTPTYGLGASLIKKEWLLNSPYDEVLDRHGIGDHYGVAAGFPSAIHVITNASVYHHQESMNRLQNSLSYYRRVLTLDYFIKTKKQLQTIKKRWLIWSLFGNLLRATLDRNKPMIKATFKSFWVVSFGGNPYIEAAKNNLKVIEPQL